MLVTLLDTSGKVLGTTFTYADGTFRFDAPTSAGCRIQATLAGFQAASVECGSGNDVKINLAVAPIEEAVVVTATWRGAP